MLRLTKSVCFALEAVREILHNPRYTQLGLNKVWESVDCKVSGQDQRIIELRVRVKGFHKAIWATCIASNRQDGNWEWMECHVEIKGNNPVSSSYFCVPMPEGQIRAYGGDHGLKYLKLDEDILRDLRATGILTILELQYLTELDVCKLFQPKDDIYLYTHPNPTEYVDRVTFDKFDRLRAKLDEKNLRLEGPRLTRQELQMQL